MILYKTKLSFNKEINFFAKNPVASNSSFIFFLDLLIHLMHWLLLCHPDDSSTPQIFPLYLGNYALTVRSGKQININIIVSDSYNTFVGFYL